MPEITPSLELRTIRDTMRAPTLDESRMMVAARDRIVRLPDIDALLELINDGSYDDHIEAILAAGHARKRERRGVRRPYGVPR